MKKSINSQKGGSCDLGACPLQMGGAMKKPGQTGAGCGCSGSSNNRVLLKGGSKKSTQKGGFGGCSNNNRKPLQMGGSKKVKRSQKSKSKSKSKKHRGGAFRSGSEVSLVKK
jgi:hypothetical protein